MGVAGLYFSDNDVICSIRKYYRKNKQFSTNFEYWLNTAKHTKDGILITVENRKFLVNTYTGMVIREVS